MIYIIEDDEIMAGCIATACKGYAVKIFSNAIAAMDAVAHQLPDLIFLDVLLTGPDGFTFLNELVSYQDTAKIPVVIVSSLNFQGQDLSNYGVVGVLDKATMTPKELRNYAQQYSSSH